MDENVNRAISEGLRLRGVDVLTAQEDGRSGAADDMILDRATALGRTLFTQDDDLLAEAHSRIKTGVAFLGVIFAHQLRVTVGTCVRDLELIAKAIVPDEVAGLVVFLPI